MAESSESAAKIVVIDLCDDRKNLTPITKGSSHHVARMPQVVELLDDDDDDDVPAPMVRKRRRRGLNQQAHIRQHFSDRDIVYIPENNENDECIIVPSKVATLGVSHDGLTDSMKKQVRFSEDHVEIKMRGTRKRSASTIFPEVQFVSSSAPLNPLHQILDVFPDVDVDHARDLLQKIGKLSEVLSVLADDSYPKALSTKKQLQVNPHGGVVLLRERGGSQYKYDYESSTSFDPSVAYFHQAQQQLLYDFPFLSKLGATKFLHAANAHYAIAHDKICASLVGGSSLSHDEAKLEEQHRLLQRALDGLPLTTPQVKHLQQSAQARGKEAMTLCRPRRRRPQQGPTVITESILLEEISYVQHKQQQWMSYAQDFLARKTARLQSEKDHSTMTCSCCYSDVAMDEMIACRQEGHLFCVDCLRRFAETQVFGVGNLGIDRKSGKPALELLCMHADGCSSGFDLECLKKALSEKVLVKYNELQFQAAIDTAGIKDICSCPKCGFRAELPETEMIFECPIADCQFQSCRKCGEPSHIPLRCEEVEKKHETQGRLQVEEAISAAKIRTCPRPNCRKKFLKESGCNKMTCACGTLICYICREMIGKVGHGHFCQTPFCTHEACKKCPLYSKDDEDDKRAMREAGIKAAEEVRAYTATTVAVAENAAFGKVPAPEFNFDVESLLKDPPTILKTGHTK